MLLDVELDMYRSGALGGTITRIKEYKFKSLFSAIHNDK